VCEPCSLGIFGDIGWEHVREIWDGVGVASTARAQLTDVLCVGRARAVRGHSSRAESNGCLFFQPQLLLTRRRISVVSDSERRALQRGVRGKTRGESSRRTRAPFTPHQV